MLPLTLWLLDKLDEKLELELLTYELLELEKLFDELELLQLFELEKFDDELLAIDDMLDEKLLELLLTDTE